MPNNNCTSSYHPWIFIYQINKILSIKHSTYRDFIIKTINITKPRFIEKNYIFFELKWRLVPTYYLTMSC